MRIYFTFERRISPSGNQAAAPVTYNMYCEAKVYRETEVFRHFAGLKYVGWLFRFGGSAAAAACMQQTRYSSLQAPWRLC